MLPNIRPTVMRAWVLAVLLASAASAQSDTDTTVVNFRVAPNPFSPFDPWGLQLSYRATSEVSTWVSVRVEVFNQGGDRVFESDEVQINKNQPVVSGTHRANPESGDRLRALAPYVWDGRDTRGLPCRNGGYRIQLTLRDGDGVRRYLQRVTLLK